SRCCRTPPAGATEKPCKSGSSELVPARPRLTVAVHSPAMNLERLVAVLAPADVVQPAPAEVRGLAYDARAVEPGFLFFCVPGATADGHDFAADAVQRGAAALVVERPLELDVPQVVVESGRAAMAVAADVF